MPTLTSAFKIIISTFFVIAVLLACRKDIDTPGDETIKVFGKWSWVSSSSDAGGIAQTPQSIGSTVELEFRSNGVFKEFTDGKKSDRLIFEFIQNTSINFELSGYKIKYRNSGLNRKEKYSEEFAIQNEDTLFLKRECAGCFTRMFVRQ